MGQRGDLRGMKECWRGEERDSRGLPGRFARDAGAFWLDLSSHCEV